jgi:hypothetical protein
MIELLQHYLYAKIRDYLPIKNPHINQVDKKIEARHFKRLVFV